MKIIKKREYAKIPKDYKGTYEDTEGTRPEWDGRRMAMLPGEGSVLSIEGIHFLVDGDYSHLPILSKENACVGACYQFAGGYTQVKKIYRLDEEYARENEFMYLDRVITSDGDFALPGSDLRSDIRTNTTKEA